MDNLSNQPHQISQPVRSSWINKSSTLWNSLQFFQGIEESSQTQSATALPWVAGTSKHTLQDTQESKHTRAVEHAWNTLVYPIFGPSHFKIDNTLQQFQKKRKAARGFITAQYMHVGSALPAKTNQCLHQYKAACCSARKP